MILKEGCSYLSMSVYLGFFLILGSTEGISSVGPCEGNHSEGCNIIENNMGKRECVCGMGCERRFQFKSTHECQSTLLISEFDHQKDPCEGNPCNQGQCIELGAGGYKCYCIGTNYYGDNCQIECPSKIGENALGLDDDYLPLECQFK